MISFKGMRNLKAAYWYVYMQIQCMDVIHNDD